MERIHCEWEKAEESGRLETFVSALVSGSGCTTFCVHLARRARGAGGEREGETDDEAGGRAWKYCK